jgi:hypothetical protein
MVIFNSYVKLPEGTHKHHPCVNRPQVATGNWQLALALGPDASRHLSAEFFFAGGCGRIGAMNLGSSSMKDDDLIIFNQ